MKERPKGFLDHYSIDHGGEPFDYIRELHEKWWELIRIVNPGASGVVTDYIEPTIEAVRRHHDAGGR